MLWHRDIDPPFGKRPEPLLHRAEQQRPAIHASRTGRSMFLSEVSDGGFVGQYHGYVVSVAVSRWPGPLGSYQVPRLNARAPSGRRTGLSCPPQGDLYVAHGQRELQATLAHFDEGDSVVELFTVAEADQLLGPPVNWASRSTTTTGPGFGRRAPINVPGDVASVHCRKAVLKRATPGTS